MTYNPMYSRQRADFVAAVEAEVQPLVDEARSYAEVAESYAETTFPEVHSATFAAIPSITGRALVTVAADETNGGLSSIYYYDGTGLLWIPTV